MIAMKSNVVVSRAKDEDVDGIVALGRQFWEESPYRDLPYSEENTRTVVEHLRKEGIVQIAKDQDNTVVGFILMVVGPLPFMEGVKAANELAFFVHTNFRNDGVGKRLLKQAENVAKQLKVVRMSMVHLNDKNSDKAEKAYRSQGYEPLEVVFTKDI
jgi:GNAT superfamily N-acetyltransferase